MQTPELHRETDGDIRQAWPHPAHRWLRSNDRKHPALRLATLWPDWRRRRFLAPGREMLPPDAFDAYSYSQCSLHRNR